MMNVMPVTQGPKMRAMALPVSGGDDNRGLFEMADTENIGFITVE